MPEASCAFPGTSEDLSRSARSGTILCTLIIRFLFFEGLMHSCSTDINIWQVQEVACRGRKPSAQRPGPAPSAALCALLPPWHLSHPSILPWGVPNWGPHGAGDNTDTSKPPASEIQKLVSSPSGGGGEQLLGKQLLCLNTAQNQDQGSLRAFPAGAMPGTCRVPRW